VIAGAEKGRSRLRPEKPWTHADGRGFDSRHLHDTTSTTRQGRWSGHVAAQWQRCEECRKIRPVPDFDDDSSVCQECRTRTVRVRPAAAATAVRSTVTVTRVAAQAAPVTSSGSLAGVGIPGRGDREVRVRRARLRALEQLATAHPEEFEELLVAARGAEGL
jgi:hypothetical protein